MPPHLRAAFHIHSTYDLPYTFVILHSKNDSGGYAMLCYEVTLIDTEIQEFNALILKGEKGYRMVQIVCLI